MHKVACHKAGHDFFQSIGINSACGDVVTAGNALLTCNGHSRDSVLFAWFESDGGSGGDVDSTAICQCAVHLEGTVGLDQVEMRADLFIIYYCFVCMAWHGTT